MLCIGMTVSAPERYLGLMKTIRARLDMISAIEKANGDSFSRAETAAFHGRKVVEGIAFSCLVATQHGLKHIPRDAKGKWNAEEILRGLLKKNLQVFPSLDARRTGCASSEGNDRRHPRAALDA